MSMTLTNVQSYCLLCNVHIVSDCMRIMGQIYV